MAALHPLHPLRSAFNEVYLRQGCIVGMFFMRVIQTTKAGQNGRKQTLHLVREHNESATKTDLNWYQ